MEQDVIELTELEVLDADLDTDLDTDVEEEKLCIPMLIQTFIY
jgi:hypothetical protein